jgi:PAS domain S-box-containing protein
VTALRSVAAGDYTARVFDTGAQDQIGLVVKSVNSMIEQIEMHTMNLQALTQAGEDLAAARDAGEIYKTVVSIVTGRFPVKAEAVCPAAAGESPGQEPGCRELVRLDPLNRKIILSGEILCAAGSAYQPAAPRGKRESGRGRFLYIPLISNDSVDEVICLDMKTAGEKFDECNEVFIRTLSRLTATAVKRLEALSEKEAAEKGYRELFTNAVEGIFRSSLAGRIEEANPSMARMMGYDTPAELMAGIRDIATEGYADADARAAIIDRLKEKGRVEDLEVQLRRRDGSQGARARRGGRPGEGRTPHPPRKEEP